MKVFIFKGLMGFLKMILIIFSVVKSGEMLDFSGLCRSVYRTQNGGRGVGTSDMSFLAIERLF